ncbi:DUF4249 family protein [Duncaniella dubosii]|uniref:DUF4249 family protein n=3 Tax=Duncaniella TaxID=2518495 RepID=A0A4P7W127_9BACT|nr:DUF4249 family protein [Duncaniella dubosii]MCX4284009.1 DUF4249 family protein [Duncaniella dubosii]QCD41125.1 DUF4249 family protein [Duncaniella dubosii]HBN63809.1 hypothetical protein [Porphyromonadaceae bacterium]
MKLHSIISALCVPLLLVSCEKELDLKYHDIAPLTVIEAQLTPDGAKVGITYTTPMDEPMDRTLLTDAVVTLTDLTDGTVYDLHTDSEGFFVDPTPGITGHDYRLAVERAGFRYEADATMYPPTEIKSLEFNWIKMPYDDVAVLKGEFYDNDTYDSECYWIKLYRNGEIYMWGEMDDRNAIDGVSTFITMTTRRDTDEEDDDTVLFDGDIITVTVSPISLAMHDYLEALQNGSNGPAMFSGDKCLGYFMATSPVSDSIVFHPDEIPEYK